MSAQISFCSMAGLRRLPAEPHFWRSLEALEELDVSQAMEFNGEAISGISTWYTGVGFGGLVSIC
jgi:hypothetical protein